MSMSATITYTSEATPTEKAVVSYTYNDEYTEVTITNYSIEGISDAKYPKFSDKVSFQAAFVNDEGVLVSAVGFDGANVALSVVTAQSEGEESGFVYLNTDGELKGVKPCTTAIT